jgi:hypothetical protein
MRESRNKLPLRQRDALAIVIEQVLDFDRLRINLHDLVATIDNVAFVSDENAIAF